MLAAKADQRSNIKQEIENAFINDLAEILAETDLIHIIGKTNEGIILAIEHDQLVDNKNTEGEIAFEINIKVKNLDYDKETSIAIYEKEQAEKEEEKKQKEIAKELKKKRDAEDRAKKKLLAEQKKKALEEKESDE